MFSVIEHIEYLMTRHDCVVVPGWGAFIANCSPAVYDGENGVMCRPHRTVGFNAEVTHNDGLLVQSLMRREGLSYDRAMRFITDTVTSFRQQLSQDSEVSMGRLGYFRRNQGRFIEFMPFTHENACDRFYGLADVGILSVEALERERAEQETLVAVPEQRNPFLRKAVRIAASVAVLIGLGIVLSTPIIVDRTHDLASMTPTVTAPHSQQLGVTVQQGVVPQAVTPVTAEQGFGGVGNTEGQYYMVIATLRNQQELTSFKNKYASLVPYMKLLDYKGMMCVYVARSDDYSKLMALRDKLPEALRDIWIYN